MDSRTESEIAADRARFMRGAIAEAKRAAARGEDAVVFVVTQWVSRVLLAEGESDGLNLRRREEYEQTTADVQARVKDAVLAEREACAKVAEDESNDPPPYSDPDGNIVDASSDEIRRAIAVAIRERTKPRCRCGHDPCECG